MLPPWAVAFAVAFELAAACDIHAERHLAKAGGSNCKGRGISHPCNEAKREWKGRRAAQAKRGSLGKPLAGARGGAPLSCLCCCFCFAAERPGPGATSLLEKDFQFRLPRSACRCAWATCHEARATRRRSPSLLENARGQGKVQRGPVPRLAPSLLSPAITTRLDPAFFRNTLDAGRIGAAHVLRY